PGMTHTHDSNRSQEQIWLMVTAGPVRGLSCWSDSEESMVVVGRAQECRLRIADPRMSREHFVAGFSDNRWWLRDLASSNGTIVNGQRISKPIELRSGDVVVAGDTRFRVLIADGGVLRFEMPSPRGAEESSNLATATGATIVD
ncbi:MAG: FHA domain-containing protein, partial [Planctomycetes bacterium]|nr:FHA domain-containing protein [Planctomycetota bacterium]